MKKRFSDSLFGAKKGYLLVESLISLLVCLLAIWTVVVMVTYISHVKSRQTINFYAFIQLVESDKYQFEIKNVNAIDVKLYSPITKKNYHLQQYDDMLRITGIKLGHVRILTQVKKVHWAKDKECLRTVVTFKNGQKCTAYSKLATKEK
ncbi:hypothetical protein YK48G_00770 [Lentilactobacillus fungorum]|uniref:Competence protein ComGF n=1 Tax=Lentilactobacillus fungorum TaxID=2201250 RepID=A0ABQ3VUU0_9LACO|nr:competence type IV pilus minor pilin ComGF [Lentilactobacillus fungorum]GHP12652.1 hypothetical protein YK48G_00770 [Lentilactobacillus fungorum]